ncbi:heterokaryon incompatibility protein-domain-containing protein [Hypoxylon rubiginosum]|uniref:Heterokaryon incompatibility protein-domain-containing protein n=1 Tax=Hypoxylon rubiginosum TaxID=110542 RepID=A0ACB9YP29_9PEZI|nr:heterokaryon incompatibility protein-domain-containing protein [Hypoxylon rubiginosum]
MGEIQEYDYDDCPLPEGNIRILLLKPDADRNGDIVVELLSYSLDELACNPERYQFTALSYSWGNGDATKAVFVDMGTADEPAPQPESDEVTKLVAPLQRRARRLNVKPNLHEFLQQSRDSKKEVGLWVDCICTNQKDNREKSDQVSRLDAIYSTAAKVSIWLGPADKDGKTDRAMDFIRFILENGTEETLKDGYAKAWSELLCLLRRGWFSRRWVVQEIALAKDAEVRCGSKTIHWRDFSDAVSIFTFNFDTILKIVKAEPVLEQSLEGITDTRSLSAQILIDVSSNPRQSLESLVSALSTFHVSDPRDTVYALLNLPTKEKSKLPEKPRTYSPPEPNYRMNPLQVYTKCVQWCVQESGSLDILCRHWAFPELKYTLDNEDYPEFVTLPSWIKTVDGSAYGVQSKGFGGRRTGESFVGTPENRCYNASLDISPTISYGIDEGTPTQREEPTNRTSEGDSKESALSPLQQPPTKKRRIHLVKRPRLDLNSSITVRGRCIARIIKPSLMPNGIIPKQVLQRLGYYSGRTEPDEIPDALWRTLVADRGPDGKAPPSWHRRACMACLVDSTSSGHMDTNRNIRHDNFKLKADFMKRVQAVCWNRAFIDCGQDDAETRLVGIGPGDAQADDLVCILYGCSVPCILRPTWRGGGDDYTPDYYKLVGEAFVLGQMDGEAFVDLSEEELKGEDFRIM